MSACMRWILVGGVILALSGSFIGKRILYPLLSKPTSAAEAQRAGDRALIDVAQMLVKVRLRDPDSAAFLGSRVVRTRGKEAVCGFVNAKNGFGGMTGHQPFVVLDAEPMLFGDDAVARDRIALLCGGR